MDFKEFEKQQAGKPAEVTQEAQEVKEVQEPLTPEEIDQAGEELHRAALRVAKIINPEANERDAHNFAHTPFFSDHLDYMENPGGTRLEYKELAAELKQKTQEAQEVLSKWEAIKKRFYQSEQWKKLQETFKDITPEQVEILLDTPAFLWQVVEMLPEILEEIRAHEKTTGSKLTFKKLLMPAGDLEDADNPREMLLSVMLTRADNREKAKAAQISRELSKNHIVPITPLSNAIRNGLIGAGPRDIPVRKEDKSRKKKAVTVYAQLYFDLTGQIKDPTEDPAGNKKNETAYMIADGAAGNIKIAKKLTAFDNAVREAIYSKITATKKYGADYWRKLTFDPISIYKEMNHTTKEPSPQRVDAIIKSLERQLCLMGVLDLSADFEMRGIKFLNPNTGKMESKVKTKGVLFELYQTDIGEGKTKYSCYRLGKYPIELAYAEQVGQIITYPANLLDVKEVDKNGKITETSLDITEGRQAIKNYLYRVIYNMKYQLKKAQENASKYNARRLQEIKTGRITPESKPEKSAADCLKEPYKEHFRILFETMFTETGLTSDDRIIIKRQRDYCFQVLDFLKARGEIRGYQKVKGDKNAIRGIDIDF